MGIRIRDQVLYHQSQPLHDTLSLKDTNIQKESTIFLTGIIIDGARTGRLLGSIDINLNNCSLHRHPICTSCNAACKKCTSTPGCSGCIQLRSTRKRVDTSQRGHDKLTQLELLGNNPIASPSREEVLPSSLLSPLTEVDAGQNISQLSLNGLDTDGMNDVSSGINFFQGNNEPTFSFEREADVNLHRMRVGDVPIPEAIEENGELSLGDCFNLLDQGRVPVKPLHEHPKIKTLQKKFLSCVDNENGGKSKDVMIHCAKCREKWLDTKRGKVSIRLRNRQREYLCKRCEDRKTKGMYDATNDMDPWHDYSHLKLPKLTEIEEQMICLVCPYMRIIRLKGGGVAYQGQILNVEQDITNICQALPLMPEELNVFLVQKRNPRAPNGYVDFHINKDNILIWLRFLKANNKYYHDIDLVDAQRRLDQIRTDKNGSIHESLRYIEEDEVEALIASATQQEVDSSDSANGNRNDDKSEDGTETYTSDSDDEEGEAVAELEVGPETGGASGEIEELPIIEETLMRPTFDNMQTEEERNVTALQRLFPNARQPPNDPIPWPTNGARVNDFDTPGLFSMAFPCLFPYGVGNPTVQDRQKEVTLDQAGKHLTKYAVNMKRVQEVTLQMIRGQ
ncbi:hypothetical protein CTEN210_12871 [Chaetoceros tenuissimus]|uniref:Ubiquitin-like domain-containing protein n=1 Tax=Chaetoceros tenuissimus TaxID=426638 RepID=A0AAD3D4J4_9STRA|nr:hypothetical protein CTEN210_12871 [Chaetoceros tenuissimus]